MLRDATIEEWMASIREIAGLAFKTAKIEKEVQVIKENEKWIDCTLALLNPTKKKVNKFEDLEKRIQELGTIKPTSKLVQSCLKALETIKSEVQDIKKSYNPKISCEELGKLVLKAKELTVRPPCEFYKNLKLHLKIFKWHQGATEKSLFLELIEPGIQNLDGDLKS